MFLVLYFSKTSVQAMNYSFLEIFSERADIVDEVETSIEQAGESEMVTINSYW